MINRTIIGGTIEFLDKGVALIHSIDEVYNVGSTQEQDALEDMLNNQGLDYIVVEEYLGTINVTNEGLLSLVGRVSGVNKKEQ